MKYICICVNNQGSCFYSNLINKQTSKPTHSPNSPTPPLPHTKRFSVSSTNGNRPRAIQKAYNLYILTLTFRRCHRLPLTTIYPPCSQPILAVTVNAGGEGERCVSLTICVESRGSGSDSGSQELDGYGMCWRSE